MAQKRSSLKKRPVVWTPEFFRLGSEYLIEPKSLKHKQVVGILRLSDGAQAYLPFEVMSSPTSDLETVHDLDQYTGGEYRLLFGVAEKSVDRTWVFRTVRGYSPRERVELADAKEYRYNGRAAKQKRKPVKRKRAGVKTLRTNPGSPLPVIRVKHSQYLPSPGKPTLAAIGSKERLAVARTLAKSGARTIVELVADGTGKRIVYIGVRDSPETVQQVADGRSANPKKAKTRPRSKSTPNGLLSWAKSKVRRKPPVIPAPTTAQMASSIAGLVDYYFKLRKVKWRIATNVVDLDRGPGNPVKTVSREDFLYDLLASPNVDHYPQAKVETAFARRWSRVPLAPAGARRFYREYEAKYKNPTGANPKAKTTIGDIVGYQPLDHLKKAELFNRITPGLSRKAGQARSMGRVKSKLGLTKEDVRLMVQPDSVDPYEKRRRAGRAGNPSSSEPMHWLQAVKNIGKLWSEWGNRSRNIPHVPTILAGMASKLKFAKSKGRLSVAKEIQAERILLGKSLAALKRQGMSVDEYYDEAKYKNPTGAGTQSRSRSHTAAQAARTHANFIGKPLSAVKTRQIQIAVKTPDNLAQIAPLVKLKLKTATGTKEIRWTGKSCPMLLSNAQGTQLYLHGGSQALDPAKLGIRSAKFLSKDMVLLGLITEISYEAQKRMHNFRMTEYYHRASENTLDSRGHRGPQTFINPMLVLDQLNRRLLIVGGTYRIKAPGIID